jgi:transposase
MFWAAFSFGCCTNLVVIEGDENTKRRGVIVEVYIEVLREYLPTSLNNNSIFIQDNTPIYKAYRVRTFLKDLGIEIIVWPPYSLDLNPIENLWKLLKVEIDRAYPELKGIGNSNTTMDFIIQCV